LTYPRSPERNVAQSYINNASRLNVPRSPMMQNSVYGGNHLSPHSPIGNYGHSPQHSPSYQQPSPCYYSNAPSPQAFPMTPNRYNEILSMTLSGVVTNPQCRTAFEHILKEKLAERKDYDNTLKRLWIFQHLVETPCQKCCFLHGDTQDADGTTIHRFRIKSKCLANHFRVSGNTPFNWLVRDFCRFHAPHSAGVAERKDLREIYYDEFSLFYQQMTAEEFIKLAEKLAGRPTTSGKKRGRSKSIENIAPQPSVTSLIVPPAKIPALDRGHSVPSISLSQAMKPQKTTANRSRLVVELRVSNSTHLIMFGQALNQEWSKTKGPLELPTFRPELATKYRLGRMDSSAPNQDKEEPYKLFIDDQSISRNHLEIRYERHGWVVMDCGSTLGTVITSTEIVEEDGEQQKVPITTALRPGDSRILQQGDVINLSDGIVILTILYHKFCSDDIPSTAL